MSLPAVALLAIAVAAVAADPALVLDFAASAGARVRLEDATAAVEDGRLRLDLGATADWPGITVEPAPAWDLVRFRRLALPVANRGRGDCTVHIRLDDPLGDGSRHSLDAATVVPAGEERVLRIAIPEPAARWFAPIGVNRAPPAYGGDGGGGIDSARVVRCIVYLPHPREPARLVLGALAGEEPRPPAAATAAARVPFIDRFGQFIPAEWPGKIHDEAELAAAAQREEAELAARPAPPGRDAWGGWADGPLLAATGFFRTERVGGRWWLVDPDGRLFWSLGLCHVACTVATPTSGREAWFADFPGGETRFAACLVPEQQPLHGFYAGAGAVAVFDFQMANLIRKHGPDWRTRNAATAVRRLAAWGFDTVANWSDWACYRAHRLPYATSIDFDAPRIAGSHGYWSAFKDPFDPRFRANLRAALAARGDALGDPWCIGFFVDNEVSWGGEGDLAAWALASPPAQPAKAATVACLRRRHGDDIADLDRAWGSAHGSWEALLAATARPGPGAAADLAAASAAIVEAYFAGIAAELRAAAPHQLYLGPRLHEWNRTVAAAAQRHLDVIACNLYRDSVADFALGGEDAKPILVSEFHWGAEDRGFPRGGLLTVATQAERAERFAGFVRGALGNPRIVGAHWFAYGDEPATGRTLDQENYNVGFVDQADVPYPEMVAAARDVAATMYRARSGGEETRPCATPSP